MLSSSMNCVADFFTYETTKSVVVKSWTIGVINRAVQLLIISYFIGYEKPKRVNDAANISSEVALGWSQETRVCLHGGCQLSKRTLELHGAGGGFEVTALTA
ncbi:UNVERIFIED_CONTAM: P2X purinoceptor 3 [Gekko kuhli]